MGVLKYTTDLNVTAFDLSKASCVFNSKPIENFSSGSVQINWFGATSSDGFTSMGTFEFKVSNDNVTFFSLTVPATLTVSAATGSKMFTFPVSGIPYIYGRLEWTKNNSTAGTGNALAIFKNHQ